MELTKFGHACVRLEKGGQRLVIDPGALSPEPDVLAGAAAVLVTHVHFDHLDAERLIAAADADPHLVVYTCQEAAEPLQVLGDRVHVLRHGDQVTVAGFSVEAVGERHHVAHPDWPPSNNIGFLIDGTVFHPGDALTEIPVQTLLVAGQAPWLTMMDLILYLRRMRPRRAYAIHDGLMNDWGLKVLGNVLDREASHLGIEIRRPAVGETIAI